MKVLFLINILIMPLPHLFRFNLHCVFQLRPPGMQNQPGKSVGGEQRAAEARTVPDVGVEPGMAEVGTSKIGALKSSAVEVGALEVGALEVGALEVGELTVSTITVQPQLVMLQDLIQLFSCNLLHGITAP